MHTDLKTNDIANQVLSKEIAKNNKNIKKLFQMTCNLCFLEVKHKTT